MNVTLLCVGKVRTEFYEPAVAQYLKRLHRWTSCNIDIIAASSLEQESAKIINRLPDSATVVLLDETGQEWNTPELAQRLENWQNQATKTIIFVIGGAYGVSELVKQRADATWALSRHVFPHELARLIVCEQLYRAYDILHDGKYHHS